MKKVLFGLFAVAMLAAKSAGAAPIMFVNDERNQLAKVDVANGSVNVLGVMLTPGDVMTDIAFDPFGNLWGISFAGLWRIDATNAATTFVGAHGIDTGNALVFGSDGTAYAAGAVSTNLFSLNLVTGLGVSLGSMGVSSGGDLAFNGGNLFLASSDSTLVRVNPTNGAPTPIGPFGVPGMFGLATGDNGVLYGVAGTGIYSVNSATGAATLVETFDAGLGNAFGQAFQGEAAPVPEPGTLLLLGGGLAAAVRRRRQKKS